MRNLKEELGENFVRFGIWPGTVKGCGKKNEDGSNSVRRLEEGKNCNNGEVYLEDIEFVNIESYGGIVLTKRTLGNNYYKLLTDGSVVSQNEDCPSTKKSCGYIDTLRNKLCIDQSENCPINYLHINKTKPTDIQITKTINGNGKNLYISNNPYADPEKAKYIFSNFKIAYEEICSIPNLYKPEYNLYILDGTFKSYANDCTLKDYNQKYAFDNTERYHKLDDIVIFDLYKENGIIDLINNSKLINYGFDLDYYFRKDKKLHLYVRTFIGFNKSCLEKRSIAFKIDQLEELETKHSLAENMRSWGAWAKGLISISEILNLIPLLDNVCGSDKKNYAFLVPFILSIASNVANIWQTTISNSYDDAYQGEFTCSDAVANDLYNIMTDKINRSGKSIRITNYFIIASLVFALVLLVLLSIKYKKQKKEGGLTMKI